MTSKSQGINSVLAQTIFENLDLEHLPRSLNPNAYGRLGRFDLMSVIGAGGMGIVFSELLRVNIVVMKVCNHEIQGHQYY